MQKAVDNPLRELGPGSKCVIDVQCVVVARQRRERVDILSTNKLKHQISIADPQLGKTIRSRTSDHRLQLIVHAVPLRDAAVSPKRCDPTASAGEPASNVGVDISLRSAIGAPRLLL